MPQVPNDPEFWMEWHLHGIFAVSYDEAERKLADQIRRRLQSESHPELTRDQWFRYPVAIFFIRGDRGGPGKAIAEQAMASFDYWDADSGKYLDVVFPGWVTNGFIEFDTKAFLEFRKGIEAFSKWQYSGETDILLLNFDFDLEGSRGIFSFEETITLLPEKMIREGQVSNLDSLMHELVKAAKQSWPRTSESPIWEMSDRIAIQRSRTALWEYVKKKLLRDFGAIYDELRPFAVCNLSKNS